MSKCTFVKVVTRESEQEVGGQRELHEGYDT